MNDIFLVHVLALSSFDKSDLFLDEFLLERCIFAGKKAGFLQPNSRPSRDVPLVTPSLLKDVSSKASFSLSGRK